MHTGATCWCRQTRTTSPRPIGETNGATVIQLQALRQPMALPESVKRAEHALDHTAVGDDLDPGMMGGYGYVDLAERVETHTAVQMARLDEVGLDHVPRLAAGAG